MKNENRLSKINIPSYTQNQELFNTVSHLLGIPLGVAVTIIASILFANQLISFIYFIGLIIFGISIITLYLVSSLYHMEDPTNEKLKKIKRIMDHCTIYFLIAGTYTPICLFINAVHPIGLVLIILQWFLATVGIIINIVDMNNSCIKAISMFLYLALGWMILFSGGFIHIPLIPFIWILVGGIVYTVGSILYGIGSKKSIFHSVFHVFVLLGTTFQAVGVLLLFM